MAKPAVPEEPQRRRKLKFSPFEDSYEEVLTEPIPIREIEWSPGQVPFTNNPWDYFALGDMVPSINLSRALRKGDILEVFVLDITTPGCFYIRILGPKKFLLLDDSHQLNSRHLSQFTAQLTSFYEKFDKEDLLQVDEELERGMLVVYKYTSQ